MVSHNLIQLWGRRLAVASANFITSVSLALFNLTAHRCLRLFPRRELLSETLCGSAPLRPFCGLNRYLILPPFWWA
jgi:hypothetical protein